MQIIMGVLVLAAGLFVLLTADAGDVRIFGGVIAAIGAVATIAALLRRRIRR